MIKITADSTCDLSKEMVETMGITLVPLYIIVGDKSFRDGVDITPEDIFRYVDREGKTCKTAAVSTYEYMSTFTELLTKYQAVIHISLSEFSSSYQTPLGKP